MTSVDGLRSARADWRPGPSDPQLAPGTIDLWLVHLDEVDAEVLGLLDRHERSGSDLVVREPQRARRMLARGALRALLGTYLAADPRSLRIVTGAHGKPMLAPSADGRPAPLAFNLSHSRSLALIAVSRSGAVGVDVEHADRRLPVRRLARHAFGAAYAERLARLDEATARRALLRAWTRHEAALKCRGAGIGVEPEGAAMTPAVYELSIGAHFVAAVASAAAVAELHRWRWAPQHD